jgi:hypothetical protein
VRGEEDLSDDRPGGGAEDDVGGVVGDDLGEVGAGDDGDLAVLPIGAGDGAGDLFVGRQDRTVDEEDSALDIRKGRQQLGRPLEIGLAVGDREDADRIGAL